MPDLQKLLAVGDTFEFKCMLNLRKCMPNAMILHDLRLDSTYLGKETQIDLVAIDDSGIFVIEAKNWKFWIRGDLDDRQWTGLSSDRKVMTVFNPYDQNIIHVRALRNAIRRRGGKPVIFHNLVVLPDGTEIYSDCKDVVNSSQLPKAIARMKKSANVNLDKKAYIEMIRGVTCS